MNFAEKFEKKKIGEWQEAYVAYSLGKTHLKPFKEAQKLLSKISEKIQLEDAEIREELDELSQFELKFQEFIRNEKEKFLMFLSLRLAELVEEYEMIKVNIAIIDGRNNPENLDETMQAKEKRHKNDLEVLRIGMKEFYKKTHLLQSYLNINHDAIKKLLKRHQKVAEPFGSELNIRRIDVGSFLQNTSFASNQATLKTIIEKTRKYFLKLFYNRFTKEKGLTELKKATFTRQISVKDSQRLFFFLGCIFSLSIVLLLMSIYGLLDPDEDSDFRPIFEMFRGALLLILYFWMLGWNVYGWNRCHVNYKKIFKFSAHYSTLPAILKRAAFLISVWLLLFLWYLLIKENYSSLDNFLPKEYTPLVVYAVILLYLLIPSKQHFNGQGRLYMFRLLGRILCFCCNKMDFIVDWGTDQLVSFVIPLQDIILTFCFYITLWMDEDTESTCQQKSISFGFLAAFVPYFLRMVQVFLLMRENRKYSGLNLINFFKYFSSFCVVFVSFLANQLDSAGLFYFWIVLAVFSAVYSYIWDLKVDWRFMQPDSRYLFLRNKRTYSRLNMYYIALVANLLMRFSWVFSISPGAVHYFIQAEGFTFFIAVVEILRRALWNFFRVESEHLETCGDQLYAIDLISLPYRNVKLEREESRNKSNSNSNEAESINPLARDSLGRRVPIMHKLSFEEGDEGIFSSKRKTTKVFVKDEQPILEDTSIGQILKKNRAETVSLRVSEERLIRERFISRPTLYQKREDLKKEVRDFTKRVRKSLTSNKAQGRKQDSPEKKENQFSLLGISLHSRDLDTIEEGNNSEMASEKKQI